MNVALHDSSFNGLVSEAVRTTSRIIAEKFEKQHKDVLRAIRNLECSDEFNERNFAPVEYLDSKGEKRTEYSVTRDGFTFLAMGFTGKPAAYWKEKFIAAFNAMEQQIKNSGGFSLPQTYPEALRLAAEQAEQIESMKPRIAALERIEAADGTFCPTDVGKMLGQRRKDFFTFLACHDWLYKRGGKGPWVGYADKEKAGYIEHTNSEVTRPDGSVKIAVQARITAKGMVKLSKMLGVDMPEIGGEA